MRNVRLFALLLFTIAIALGPPLEAQSKAGPFTISSSTSPCAQISASAQATVVIKVAGTFSMTLQPEISIQGQPADNTQVTPTTSATPQSTITATGTYTAAVAGGDTFLVCVSSYVSGSATIYLNTSQAVSANVISGAGSGVIASGNSLPATPCAANTLFNLKGTGGNTDSLYRCSQINGANGYWQQVKPTVETVYAKDYGVIANGGFIGDASVSNGGTVITCPNSDCNFINAAQPSGHIGDIVFLYTNAASGVPVIAQTTIASVNGPQSITVAAGTASQACVAVCALVWGPDDSAALDRAYTVAANTCNTLQLPTGIILTQQPQFNYQAGCSTQNGTFNYQQPNVFGAGSSSTVLVPTPNFSTTAGHGCPGACFFGVQFQLVLDVSIKALGYGISANLPTVLVGNFGALHSVTVYQNWCGGCAGTIGYQQSGSQASMFLGGVQAFGAIACQSSGTASQLINVPCTGLNVTAGSLQSLSNAYNGTVTISAGAVMSSRDDEDAPSSGGANIKNSGRLFLSNYLFTTGRTQPVFNLQGGVMTAEDTTFVGAASGSLINQWLQEDDTATLSDLGGNAFPSQAALSSSPTILQSRATSTAAGTTPYTLAFTSNTCGATACHGNLLQAFVSWAPSTNTLTGCTDTLGNTWSQNGATLTTTSVSGAARNVAMLTVTLNKPAGGADTISCAFSGNNTTTNIALMEWKQANAAYDLAIQTNSGNGTAISGTQTTVTNNSVTGFVIQDNVATSIASGVCSPINPCSAWPWNLTAAGFYGEFQIVPTAGATTSAGTIGSTSDWAGFWFTVRPLNSQPILTGIASTTGTRVTAAKLVLSGTWGSTASWTTGPVGYNNFQGTITASGVGQGASPTITYTFPTAYPVPPQYCSATQVGGTQTQGQFTASTPTATAVTFTYSGTPGAGNTVVLHGECYTQ